MTVVVLNVSGSKPQPIDVSTRVGNMIREASRRAISSGSVRADVQVASGCGRARTKITSTGSTYTLNLLVEGTTSGTCSWTQLDSYAVPGSVTTDSFSTTVGAKTAVTTSTTWSGFSIGCYSTGICDSATVFFQRSSGAAKQSRVSALPLGGAVYIRKDWN
jgi:hypothetical protein